MVDSFKCCMCEKEFDKNKLKHIKIKDDVKDICRECATAITGLV